MAHAAKVAGNGHPCPQGFDGFDRDILYQATVNEGSITNNHGDIDARNSSRGTDGVSHRPAGENHFFTAVDVGRHNSQWNLGIFNVHIAQILKHELFEGVGREKTGLVKLKGGYL